MLNGLAITPIVDGRISIGEIDSSSGKRLPKKNDFISITKNFQVNHTWAPHPEMVRLLEEQKNSGIANPDKLRSIPVRIMFDRPTNNFRASYTCFSKEGRTLCLGNGVTAKRETENSIEEVACPGADTCEFGKHNRCKPFARLMVALENEFENDPLSGFMFRSTSINSIRVLTFRLQAFAALLNGKMSGMPCNLVIKANRSTSSFGTLFYYLDLEPRGGLYEAARQTTKFQQAFAAAGLDRDSLEQMVADGIAQSNFYDADEPSAEIVEEFFNEVENEVESDEVVMSEQEIQQALNTCTSDQVAEIEKLLDTAGKSLPGLMNWLVKPAGTLLTSLTRDEAVRCIEKLTSESEKSNVTSPTPQVPIPPSNPIVVNTNMAAKVTRKSDSTTPTPTKAFTVNQKLVAASTNSSAAGKANPYF